MRLPSIAMWIPAALVVAGAVATACASAPPGAQNEPEPPPVRPYSRTEVGFLQGMIHHHGQALEMTALVPDRDASDAVRALAGRIDISQRDEIARMEEWLRARGESVPDEHAHLPMMPGMLSAEQMASLRGASGATFDRLFLELMIQHHEGALVMVRELLSASGISLDPRIYMFANEIDADQRAEIARMRGLLSTTSQGGRK